MYESNTQRWKRVLLAVDCHGQGHLSNWVFTEDGGQAEYISTQK